MSEPSIHACVAGTRQLDALQSIASRAMQLLGRVRVDGGGLLPASGPVVLAMNHCSMLDGPLLCGLLSRPVCCLVKAEAFGPGVGWLLRRAGQVAVVRDAVDPAPIRRCLAILQAGGAIGIFPEGRRGDGSVRRARPGVGYFALRTGATVVPVACHGSARLGRTAHRAPVLVTVGLPLPFAAWAPDRPLPRQQVATATEVVRERLAALVDATRPGGTPMPGTLAR
jgi:1-acyl-sn-glycerol-3-phosphate acyltransferase